MRRGRNIGFVLLAAWLILTGLSAFVDFAIPGFGLVMAILALAAGILILMAR